MPIKVYHPDHGFVLTNDQTEIDMLVAKGGKVVIKNSEVIYEPRKVELEHEVPSEQHQKTEEAPKAEVLGKPKHINRKPEPQKIFKKREPDNTAMRMITTGVF